MDPAEAGWSCSCPIITGETRPVSISLQLGASGGQLTAERSGSRGLQSLRVPLECPSGVEIPVLQGRDSGLGATRVRGVRNAGSRTPLTLL